jgi:hypothetical protein
MKKLTNLFVVAMMVLAATANGQVLNRLKNRASNNAEQKAGEAIDNLFNGKKKDQNNQNNQGNQGPNGPGGANGQNGMGGPGGRSNPANRGGGLISTPPDVKQNLTDAEVAYKKNAFGDSRYSVQQAMLGVEMEIGNQILKSLPETVAGLKREASADQVTSAGWGWSGLTIHREYGDGKDKELRVSIANNSVWMAGVNAYLTSGGYAQTNNGQQNWKQVKVKGYRSIIEYDDSSGYRLSVPLGQSSLILYEGVNFANENDVIRAAEVLDIDNIKKQLGEQ